MDIRALKTFPYGGRRYRVGDLLQIRPSHARLLVAIGRAEIAPPPSAPAPVKAAEAAPPSTEEFVATLQGISDRISDQTAPAPAVEQEPEAKKPARALPVKDKARTYGRRDMTAEE